MNAVLDNLIGRFRNAQDLAVHVLVRTLGIPIPQSNWDWVEYCEQSGLYRNRRIRGVALYAHGYGIELRFGNVTIDFDWGDQGESDGFDAWRLWVFRLENCPEVDCSYNDLKSWLLTAFAKGELLRDESLFYAPNRRAAGNGQSANGED